MVVWSDSRHSWTHILHRPAPQSMNCSSTCRPHPPTNFDWATDYSDYQSDPADNFLNDLPILSSSQPSIISARPLRRSTRMADSLIGGFQPKEGGDVVTSQWFARVIIVWLTNVLSSVFIRLWSQWVFSVYSKFHYLSSCHYLLTHKSCLMFSI